MSLTGLASKCVRDRRKDILAKPYETSYKRSTFNYDSNKCIKTVKEVISKETVLLRRWENGTRKIGDRCRERTVERNDKDASKPVARHFNLAP